MRPGAAVGALADGARHGAVRVLHELHELGVPAELDALFLAVLAQHVLAVDDVGRACELGVSRPAGDVAGGLAAAPLWLPAPSWSSCHPPVRKKPPDPELNLNPGAFVCTAV